MEKLKVGDKVYTVSNNRWTSETNYIQSEVIRLTNTQAVLSNTDKLINEVTTDWHRKECFAEYGNRGTKWYLVTDEVILEIKKENERRIVKNWFENRKFTDEEKKIVYVHFKSLNILNTESK